MKKIVASFLIMFLLICVFPNTFFADDEEITNEENTTEEECDKQCQIKNAQQSVNDYRSKLKEAKQNQKEYSDLLNDCGNKLQVLYDDINELTPQIEELGILIEELQKSIEENEVKVEDLNDRVLTRMKNAQGTMHYNPYLNFILGSNSFSDMLRRIYGIKAINDKEEDDRDELNDIITQLTEDKDRMSQVKEELDNKMNELEIKKIELEELEALYKEKKQEADDEVAYYQNLYDNALQNRRQVVVSKEDLAAMVSSSGFKSCVPDASISSNFPYYPASFGGGIHLGIDYAAKMGSYIYAPADGVILVVDDGNCPSVGYLGNSCGGAGGGVSYGGNQIYMICSVNDSVYALTFSHLSLNSTVVSVGEVVLQGDIIAQVGSSGNSTGAHCHIEMFYLGEGDNEDLYDYINLFNKGSYSLSFNCGWGSAGLSTTCDNKGSAPCRLNGSYYLP